MTVNEAPTKRPVNGGSLITEQLEGRPPILLDNTKGEMTPSVAVCPLTLLANAQGLVRIIDPAKAPPF